MGEIKKPKIREENNITINNELLPTLDCIFNYDEYISNPQISNLVDFNKQNLKNEELLCLDISKLNADTSIKIAIKSAIHNNLRLGSYDPHFFPFIKHNRKDVENFSNSIQIVTAAMIYDDTHILLLSNLNPNAFYNRATLSFIQGHVAYPEDVLLTIEGILRDNMYKELGEEIGSLDDSFKFDLENKKINIIYLPTRPSTNKHCCILYDIKVPDTSTFYSKENDKSSIVRLRIDQIHTQYNNICPWVLHSLQYSDHVRNIYLEYLKTLKY